MSDTPTRASAVVIGAGIVGNSLVYHLSQLGWKDIVLVDKGPLPNPGGSTGHASNFVFPIEYARLMFELTRDSTEQYKELGVFTESGGIEVARTPQRMEELKRRVTKAKAWGIPAEHLTPEGVQKLVPYLDPSVILGGGYFPTVGVVDSLRAGTLMRERAEQQHGSDRKRRDGRDQHDRDDPAPQPDGAASALREGRNRHPLPHLNCPGGGTRHHGR